MAKDFWRVAEPSHESVFGPRFGTRVWTQAYCLASYPAQSKLAPCRTGSRRGCPALSPPFIIATKGGLKVPSPMIASYRQSRSRLAIKIILCVVDNFGVCWDVSTCESEIYLYHNLRDSRATIFCKLKERCQKRAATEKRQPTPGN